MNDITQMENFPTLLEIGQAVQSLLGVIGLTGLKFEVDRVPIDGEPNTYVVKFEWGRFAIGSGNGRRWVPAAVVDCANEECAETLHAAAICNKMVPLPAALAMGITHAITEAIIAPYSEMIMSQEDIQ